MTSSFADEPYPPPGFVFITSAAFTLADGAPYQTRAFLLTASLARPRAVEKEEQRVKRCTGEAWYGVRADMSRGYVDACFNIHF